MTDTPPRRHLDSDTRLVVLTDSGAIPSLFVRLLDPLPLMTQNYNIIHSDTSGMELVAASADLLVLQRWFNTPIRRLAQDAKRRGVPVIYETDDNLMDLSEHSQIKFSQEQIENMRAVAELADLVVCSTESLARFFRGLNPNVRVIRNYGLTKKAAQQQDHPHLAIVNTDYFKLGATKKSFFRALEAAIAEFDYRITFFGSLDPLAIELMTERPEHVSHYVGKAIDDRSAFIDVLAQSGVNVAAVPLSDTPQHAYKSDIKFLDFASIGVPGIYNNASVYSDVQPGIDGAICEDSFLGWRGALAEFAHADRRQTCGAAAKRVVEDGRSLEAYAAEYADVLARLKAGDSAATLATPAPSIASAAAHDDADETGLLWFGGRLYVNALGRRRHVRVVDLIPAALDAGLSFVGLEAGGALELLEGPPLSSTAQLHELLRRVEREGHKTRGESQGLKISWISPGLVIGGGGHRNIIRCAYHLERLGHDVTLYFTDTNDPSSVIADQVREHFYPFEGHVGRLDEAEPSGDILMATHWSTVAHAETIADAFGEIIYFVQDFEPSFYPTGSAYVEAESTYRRGYYAITSGEWCEQFLKERFGAEADHFRFPIDKMIYYERPQLRRANRLLFFAKPEMTRRCFELGVAALEHLHRLRPDVEIGFYGSSHAVNVPTKFPVTHYGLLPGPQDLAELYASSRAGMVFSTTNPSLVPYEMMACGLPVVDLRRPGNEANYGGRYDIAFLADPEPSRMAAEVAKLLEDETDLRRRSGAGLEFAGGFPVEQEVGTLIESYIRKRVDAWPPERRMRAGGRS